MKRCKYISLDSPFVIPDGFSFRFYYVVFCSDSITYCPFNYLPHHLITVDEFQCYPVKNLQLELDLFNCSVYES